MNDGIRVQEFYHTRYGNWNFDRQYSTKQHVELFERVAHILRSLNVSYALDIGCSLGGLVELLNQTGIDAWGADFDFARLRAAHALLKSKEKFLYGDVSELPVVDIPRHASAVILLDTLRYVTMPARIAELGAEFIIVKEVASGPWAQRVRKKQFQLKLYSPADCRGLFPGYRVRTLFGPRFAFALRHPMEIALRAANLMPTYVMVLQRI